MNAIIAAMTLKYAYKVGVFGSTIVVTDDRHKTSRYEFATRQEAADVAMELVSRCKMYFKPADMAWLKAEATRSQYVARGIICA